MRAKAWRNLFKESAQTAKLVGGAITKLYGMGDLSTASIPPMTAARVSLASNFGVGVGQLQALKKIDTAWMRTFMSKIPGPIRRLGGKIGRNPISSAIGLTTLTMGVNMVGGLLKSFRSAPIGRIAAAGTGPGYISWQKRSGMPANHMSSEGLSLSLHKMRHASTI